MSNKPKQSSLILNAKSIPFVEEVVDLGIKMDKKFRFTSHVAAISCKGHKRANLILKCFHSKDTFSLLAAFRVYVRPILEHNCVVWNPFLLKDINALERVQRRFTKLLPHFKNLTYHQRLSKLGIESLELRCIRAGLLFAYKLVFGPVDMNAEVFFKTRFTTTNSRRGHRYKLFLPTCKTSMRYNCFSCRVVRVWNCLPDCVVFTSYRAFKASLTRSVLAKFCKVHFT